MSNLGSVLNSALSSMTASQLALAVSSNNIANAQNPNFSKQRLNVTSAPTVGILGIGTGVGVTGLSSMRDLLLERRLLQETASRAGGESLHHALSDIEILFNDSESTGLLPGLTKFFNSFQTLSNDPVSPNFREQVRSSAQVLADSFESHRQNLSHLQRIANQTIHSQVDQINSIAQQIANLNARIGNYSSTPGFTPDLLDQRAALVRELAQIAEVRELESDGTYQLTIGTNRLLVMDGTAEPLVRTADIDGFYRIESAGYDITSEIRGGEIQAQIATRDTYIPNYLSNLDQLAYEIVQQVNSRHSAGYDLNGNTGINFFNPLASADGAAAQMSLSAEVASSVSGIVASGQSTGQDNQVAQGIGNLIFEPAFSGGSVADQYGSLIFRIGTDVSNAEVSYREHEALAHQLEIRRQAVSGVSIDEETIQILQFQRAFEASARLIRVVDELSQLLMGIGLPQ